jgi:hypothetical protein
MVTSLNRIGKRRPFGHGIAETLGQRVAIRQAKLLRHEVPARDEIVGVPLGLTAFARCPIRREKGIVRHRAVGHRLQYLMQIGEHAALEVDQRPDDVESQHFEVPKGHENAPE